MGKKKSEFVEILEGGLTKDEVNDKLNHYAQTLTSYGRGADHYVTIAKSWGVYRIELWKRVEN